MRIATILIVLAFACGPAATPAAAQLLDTLLPPGVPGYGTAPGVTVASRIRPGTEPLGVRAGAFVLQPLLQQSLGYDDNVLGGSRKQGSAEVVTQPSLLLTSDWSRDGIGAFLAADDRRDLDAPAQSRTDWTASLGGDVEFDRDRLTLGVAHFRRHQDRTELDALPSDRPVAFQVDDARAAYAWTSGRWTLTPALEASAWRFDPTSIVGVPASQAYRDRDVLQGGVTLSYELAPLRDLLLQVRGIGQHYAHPSASQASENATTAQFLAGFDYDDNALWRYRLLAGGERRSFAAAGLPAHTGAIAEAELAWSPTGLTTLTATLTRRIEDAAQEGVAGYTYTGARLRVDHEYRRDLLLQASAGLQQADFLRSVAPPTAALPGGGRQTGYTLGVGASWLVNRSLRLSLTYDLTGQHGGNTGAPATSNDYTRSLALVTVRLGL